MWVDTIDEQDATGELARLYKSVWRDWGGVDNIVKSSSRHVPGLRALLYVYKRVMHASEGPLTLGQREMIAVTVSSINACHY
jgi:alkylhydroperoxidase family enzyme